MFFLKTFIISSNKINKVIVAKTERIINYKTIKTTIISYFLINSIFTITIMLFCGLIECRTILQYSIFVAACGHFTDMYTHAHKCMKVCMGQDFVDHDKG